ncbi:GNAT family N-acetyltransferase [Paractinoplanes rishiriensis]|uniref:N-acetyltransferase domain-containing protein n=1 Tax=Paractinoplanes rishiriensis TaxID=1050105 RepID=A0A919JYB1_9ACTN|nr:N-acetyltransferase [Actinoplanes rishiriensis]GIE96973.1 hypothetical protein Ari01nite_44380 [Actinoplanes rishiriensis]
MTSTDEPARSALAGDIPDELVRLAGRCLAADGGLPLAADPGFLRRRWQAPPGETFALRAADGSLLAAGAVSPGPNSPIPTGSIPTGPIPTGPIVTGLVDPSARGRGLGARVLDHALSLAEAGQAGAPLALAEGGAPAAVVVETESLTDAADQLFTARGLRQFFAEDVMRIDPSSITAPTWPPSTTCSEWSAKTAPRFHAVYAASFRDRPGFPDPPAEEWIADYASDDEFRPGWSLLASTADLGDVGFVAAADGWIVQVGVVPQARGRGIGEALMRESLSRMEGTEAWLTVNVNNPGAAALYRRLGFTDQGRRARYRR